MKREIHPYGEFIPKKSTAMIIGSFPIGKFSDPKRRHEIKGHELDFFFGGEKNLLWKLLGEVFEADVSSKENIQKLLQKQRIGIGDVIRSCIRKNGGGSDSDLFEIEWNTELINVIRVHKIKRLYFTSKKVESWFNKLFKDTDDLEKITLISPSAQSLRALGSRDDFKAWVRKNPNKRKFIFILEDYRKKFETNA